MRTIKSILGYTIAIIMIFVVLATFITMNGFYKVFEKTGIVVSPIYTGGKVVKTIEKADYNIKIHEPVFIGLIKPSKEGFVQIGIECGGDKTLPDSIDENIDYNIDGKDDFRLVYDTVNNKANVYGYSTEVGSAGETYKLKKGYAVRVKLVIP